MEPASTPEGRAYARVVGWRDELDVPVEPPVFPDRPPADAEPSVQRAWGELVERMQAEYERQLEEAAAIREMLPLRTGLRLIPDQLVVIRTDYGEITVQMRWDAALTHGGTFFKVGSEWVLPRCDLPPDRAVHRQRRPFCHSSRRSFGHRQWGPGTWLPMERSTLPHDFGVISMARDNDPDSAGPIFPVLVERGDRSFGWVVHLFWRDAFRCGRYPLHRQCGACRSGDRIARPPAPNPRHAFGASATPDGSPSTRNR